MKRKLLCPLLLVLTSLVVYRHYWLLDRYFCGSDFVQQLVPLLNFQADALRAGSLPLWNPYMNFGYPWVDHYLSSFLFPTHFLLGLLGAGLNAAQIEVLGWIIIGGVGMYAAVRALGLSPVTALACGICFMFSGPMLPLPNWSNQVYNACGYPWLLYGYFRARDRHEPFSPVSIIAVALMLLGGYIASSVVGFYLFGLFVVLDTIRHRKPMFSLLYLLLTLLLGALIALPKIAPLIAGMSGSPRLSSQPDRDVDYGMITLSSFISMLIPIKFYFSLYGGSALVIALTSSLFRRRNFAYPLLLTAAIGAWLLLSDDTGAPSVLKTAASVILPFMKQVRLEFMYWYYPLIFLLLFAARSLHDFIEEDSLRRRLLAAGLAICLAIGFFFTVYAIRLHLEAFLVQIALLLGWLLVVSLPKAWRLYGVAILLCAEFTLIQGRVAIDQPYERSGDRLVLTLHDQNFLIPSYRDDERVSNQWLMEFVNDSLRPTMAESLRNPVLRCYPYDSPNENWADVMNFKVFSGIWYNTQERVDFVRLRSSPSFEQIDNIMLYGYYGYGPPGEIALDRITGTEFLFHISTTTDGILILRQLFDPRWRAVVDAKPAEVVTAEGVFMGVNLPPGEHQVRFTFTDRLFTVSLVMSLTTLAGMAVFSLRRRGSLGRWAKRTGTA